jgi:hypothetical protein
MWQLNVAKAWERWWHGEKFFVRYLNYYLRASETFSMNDSYKIIELCESAEI